MLHALVVDSDRVWRETVARAVRKFERCHVQIASNLAEGCALIHSATDLVVTEVLLDREACFPLLHTAREKSPGARLVAVSGSASRTQVFRLHDYRVDAYLEKPFRTADLYRYLEPASPPGLRRRVQPRAISGNGVEPALNQFRQRYCLSSAQCEILRCGLQGLRPSEIARERGVSINTIKTQIRQLLAKTGALNLPMLIARVRGAAEI